MEDLIREHLELIIKLTEALEYTNNLIDTDEYPTVYEDNKELIELAEYKIS